MLEQVLSTLTDPQLRIALACSGACLLLTAGFCAGRRGQSRLRRQAHEAASRCARLERQAKVRARERASDRSSDSGSTDSREGTVASLAMSLPHVVSQLNRSDLDMKAIPDLILDLAHAIFKPSQALFYIARRAAGKAELHLMAQRGLPTTPEEIKVIPFGEGKIGWVAENRLDKVRSEWRALWRGEEGRIADNHPSLAVDIVGPMMHHTDTGDSVLGVICLGQPGAQSREDKLLFQMVTNLGSLALVNAMNVHLLRGQAHTDGLTGLFNKAFFMREVAAQMLTASQTAQKFSIFIFDIDHFKTYNDTNGHPAGDALLKGLAALLKDLNRPGDMLCRYGGEEFIIAMPDTDGHTALEVAESMRKTIEETHFEFQENQPNGNLTISGGVAAYPKDGQSLDELIRFADEALYNGKRAGRNAVSRYQGVHLGEAEHETDTDLCPASA